MKVLVVGAGVIGSFNTARLFRSGVDVKLLARGERLAALREHGVVLEDWRSRLGQATRPLTGAKAPPHSAKSHSEAVVRDRTSVPSGRLPIVRRSEGHNSRRVPERME